MQNDQTVIKKVTLLADNYQVLIADQESDDDLSDIWDDRSSDEKISVQKSCAAIGTQTNSTISIVVEITGKQPKIDINKWEHISEFSIHLPTGNLCLNSITDYPLGPPLFKLNPGYYRIMALHRNLIATHLNVENKPEDCRIIAWQSEYLPKKIVKQWISRTGGL